MKIPIANADEVLRPDPLEHVRLAARSRGSNKTSHPRWAHTSPRYAQRIIPKSRDFH